MKKLLCTLLIGWFYVASCSLFAQENTSPRNLIDTTEQVSADRRNNKNQESKPYLILISLDGFRHDYAAKYQAEFLLQKAREGVQAVSMIPSYPSVTFPNHYSIITGLYPAHHGLVANSFYDAKKQRSYSMSDKKEVADSSWYGGTPLWALAEQQGMLSASMFWVASEAAIGGFRPSHYYHFNDRMEIGKRIDAVTRWLSLPAAERPHFITFYLSEVDHAGHTYGPDAPETAASVRYADSVIQALSNAVAKTGLPVNFVVVGDHGMTGVDTLHPIPLPVINPDQFRMQYSGTTVHIYAKANAPLTELYQMLSTTASGYTVFWKKDLPDSLHYAAKDDRFNRIGDIVLLPEWPKVFSNRKPGRGYHGFEPYKVKDMHTIFYAWGPGFRKGLSVPAFENVHLYPMMARLLRLHYTEKLDGDPKTLKKFVR